MKMNAVDFLTNKSPFTRYVYIIIFNNRRCSL
jgi:hypothetical protein